MRWHYNLVNQGGGPLVRDCDIYAVSGLIAGEALTAIAGVNQAQLQAPSGATVPDFVGVLLETPTLQASAVTTGTLYQAKVCLNPDAIYIAEHETTDKYDITSSTSAVVTVPTIDDNTDGSWGYITAGTGIGQLFFVGAADTTTLTLDTTTAFVVTPDSTSDMIHIRAKNSPQDLDSTYTQCKTLAATTALNFVLDTYIQSTYVPFGPLRPRQHHMLTGLNNQAVKFYSDLFFEANIFNQSARWY